MRRRSAFGFSRPLRYLRSLPSRTDRPHTRLLLYSTHFISIPTLLDDFCAPTPQSYHPASRYFPVCGPSPKPVRRALLRLLTTEPPHAATLRPLVFAPTFHIRTPDLALFVRPHVLITTLNCSDRNFAAKGESTWLGPRQWDKAASEEPLEPPPRMTASRLHLCLPRIRGIRGVSDSNMFTSWPVSLTLCYLTSTPSAGVPQIVRFDPDACTGRGFT